MYKIPSFIAGFFREGTAESSKRLISLSATLSLLWGFSFAMAKAATDVARQNLVSSMELFVGVMTGVIAFAQVVSLIRGGNNTEPEKKEEVPQNNP